MMWLVAALLACLSAHAEPAPDQFLIFGGPEVYRSSLSGNDTVRLRPRLAGEARLLDNVIVHGDITFEKIPYGPDALHRTEISVGLGIHLLEHLVLAGVVTTESTDYTGYNSASSAGAGVRLIHLVPVGSDSKIRIVNMLGFDYFGPVVLQHDQTIPSTSLDSAVCTFFTLGLGSCGSQVVHTYASFPAARQYFLQIGLGYVF